MDETAFSRNFLVLALFFIPSVMALSFYIYKKLTPKYEWEFPRPVAFYFLSFAFSTGIGLSFGISVILTDRNYKFALMIFLIFVLFGFLGGGLVHERLLFFEQTNKFSKKTATQRKRHFTDPRTQERKEGTRARTCPPRIK